MFDFHDHSLEKKEEIVKSPTTSRISLDEILFEGGTIELPDLDEIQGAKIEYRFRQHVVKTLNAEVKHFKLAKIQYSIKRYVSKFLRFNESEEYRVRLAALYRSTDDSEAAEKIYRSSASESDVLRIKYAELLFQQRRLEEVESLLRHGQESLDSLLLKSSLKVFMGLVDEASSLADQAVLVNPENPRSLKMAVLTRILQGKYAEAIPFIREALDDEPRNSNLFRLLGICYYGLKRTDKSIQAFSQSLELLPTNRDALINLYQISKRPSDLRLLVHHFQKYLLFHYDDSLVLDICSVALIKIGRFKEAVLILKRVIAIDEKAHLYHNLAVANSRMGNHKQALILHEEALRRLKSDDPLEILVFTNVIKTLRALELEGKAKDLIEQYLEKIRKNSNKKHLWSCLIQVGLVYGELNDSEKAITFFDEVRQSISEGEAYFDSLVFLTAHYSRSPKFKDRFVELVFSLKDLPVKKQIPENTVVTLINNIAFGFLSYGNVDEAKEWLGKISNYIHKNPYVTATHGLLNIKLGRVEKGEEFYLEAIALFDELDAKKLCKQKMNLELGRYYLEKNLFDSAKSYLNRAQKVKVKDKSYLPDIGLLEKALFGK